MPARSIRPAARGLGGLILIALFAAACSSTAATSAPPASVVPVATPPASVAPVATTPASAPAASTPASSAAAGVVVNMATTSLGPTLVASTGLTLYTHTGDTATSSSCTGTCAANWPPLAVAAGTTATAGTGVTGTLGTLTRDDGTLQVTYNGLPLYGWKNDAAAGDVTGQGINGFAAGKP